MKKIIKKIIKNLLKIFYVFPINNKEIFLLSFDGKSNYGFDGRAIVDYSNYKKLGYKFYWGINTGQEIKPHQNVFYVKKKSIIGIYKMLTCGVFITNINPPSYVPFRKKQTLINTWHGLAMKKFGKYDKSYDLHQINMVNCFISHSKQYTDYGLIDSLEFKGDILNCGAPRNDVLFNTEEIKKRNLLVRKIFNINKDDYVVLYTPTFRGDFNSPDLVLDYDLISKSLKEKTKREVVFLTRLHPMISNKVKITGENVRDASNYEDIQDLYCAADMLITDYSSTSYDFSLTKKPVIIHAFDIKNYEKGRGLSDLFFNRPYPITTTIEELIKVIENFNYKEYNNDLEKYFNRVEIYDNGQACKCIFDYIDERRNKI